MVEHVPYMVAIDTGNGQQRDMDNDEVLCSTFFNMPVWTHLRYSFVFALPYLKKVWMIFFYLGRPYGIVWSKTFCQPSYLIGTA